MIKTAAALAVALGFALGGKCVASFYAGRVRVIRESLLLISAVETGVRFAHLTVEQLLREQDKNGGFVYLDFIADCRRRMESGEPFPSAWRKSIEQRGELCRLLGEAKNSGIKPEVKNLFERYPIQNAEHTSDDKAFVGGSWKQYWKIFAQEDFPNKCPFC